MAFPDAWEEVALITIDKFDASSPLTVQAAAMTETIDISEPDYPGESIPSIAGGRIWKQSPQEDGEVTIEIYPIEIENLNGSVTANLGLFDFFVGGSPAAAEPRLTDTSWAAGVNRVRDQFRLTIMWTNDNVSGTPPTSATDTTDASSDALRFAAMGCRFISHKAAFTDGVLKITATFKFPAFNKAGDVKMYRWESAAQTAIGAISAYNDADSWT